MKPAIALLMGLAAAANFTADELTYDFDSLPQVDPSEFTEEFIDSRVNHFDWQDQRTYRHRYFKNDKYWDRTNGPIFINLCGEYVCSINPSRMFPWQLAAQYHALMLSVEHRYYGKSQPTSDWSIPNLAYLDTN